jgi:hypothetical protein
MFMVPEMLFLNVGTKAIPWQPAVGEGMKWEAITWDLVALSTRYLERITANRFVQNLKLSME